MAKSRFVIASYQNTCLLEILSEDVVSIQFLWVSLFELHELLFIVEEEIFIENLEEKKIGEDLR